MLPQYQVGKILLGHFFALSHCMLSSDKFTNKMLSRTLKPAPNKLKLR